MLALLSLLSLLIPTNVFAASSSGYDISWPQCGQPVPSNQSNIAVIGVTGGRSFTVNPCLGQEFTWAQKAGRGFAVYLNVNFPAGSTIHRGDNGPKGACASDDWACKAYNYGFNNAEFAVHYAQTQHAVADTWWIDVETANSWSDNTAQNAQVIQGAVDALGAHGLAVGVYSIRSMWQEIAGSYAVGLPNWVVQTDSATSTTAFCSGHYAFGGGTVAMVQAPGDVYDQDVGCPTNAFARQASFVPFPLVGAQHGELVGRHGGISTFYALPAVGAGATQSVTLDFSPAGPNTAGALFVTVMQNGVTLANVRGTDTPTPGHLVLSFSPLAAGPVIVRLQSYNDVNTPPIDYVIRVN